MPYKSKEAQREANREAQKRRYEKINLIPDKENLIPEAEVGITEKPHTLEPHTQNLIPDPWQHVQEFIKRTEPPGTMPYLERLQRIAGSLGKNAHEVRFGIFTMEDIGHVIGTLPPVIGRK